MCTYNESIKTLAVKLFEINAFKFGDFKMKVGINSPVYFDLRVIVSHPSVMETVSTLINDFCISNKINLCNHLCGVPYTALPVATLVSVKSETPMLIRRKEAKTYGTKKLIEGQFKDGDTCLIIEDVVTSGSSILETVKDLRSEGLKVTDAIVVVDREQGGSSNIENHGVKMHSLFTLTQLLEILRDAEKITQETVDSVKAYIKKVQIKPDGSFKNGKAEETQIERTKLTYEERAKLCQNEISKQLFEIMSVKNTNLCVAVDLTKTTEILNVVEQVAPYVCIVKTHCDIIEDFNEGFVQQLTKLAKKYNFLIMEDRKFADIGNTVQLQLTSGVFKIGSWADLFTVHGISGPGILESIQQGIKLHSLGDKGVFLLAEMSSKDNLLTPTYAEEIVKQATKYPSLVTGFVCQASTVVKDPSLIQFTPGVQLNHENDSLDQIYNSPDKVIKEHGADIAVVGRGITSSKNPENMAKIYREQLWQSYLERVQ